MSAMLFENGKKIIVFIDGCGQVLEIPKENLKEGAVFGAINEGTGNVRLWLENKKIVVMHLLRFEVGWPHEIFEFPAVFTQITRPVNIIDIKDFLAKGCGIPAVT